MSRYTLPVDQHSSHSISFSDTDLLLPEQPGYLADPLRQMAAVRAEGQPQQIGRLFLVGRGLEIGMMYQNQTA